MRAAQDGSREVELVVEGIRCAACAWLIETAVARAPGVASLRVNATTRDARLLWNPAAGPLSDIFHAVHRIGYRAWPREEGVRDLVERRERRALLRRLWVAGLAMMQVMMYAVPGLPRRRRGHGARHRRPHALGGIAPHGAGDRVFGGALLPRRMARRARHARSAWTCPWRSASRWRSSRARGPRCAGAGAVYFDSVTMFVFLLLGGRYLEHLARSRAARSLAASHRVRPASGVAPRGRKPPRNRAGARGAAARRATACSCAPASPPPRTACSRARARR